jgi:putative endonuclease
MYCVYILRSTVTHRYYTGSTDDLHNRFNDHNTGQVKSTKNGIPWKVVHTEFHKTRAEAMRKEKYIKSRGAKRYLEDLQRNHKKRSG